MQLGTYRDAALAGFTQVTNYRSEVWVGLVSKILSLGGVILLWAIISRETQGGYNFNILIPYFLIATASADLTDAASNRFTRVLNDEIKEGTLSSHLLRPVHPVLFLYSRFWGRRGVTVIMALLALFISLFFIPDIFWQNILLFLFSLVLATVVAFSINLLVGTLTFWTTEADHLQNVVSHVIRVFSGILIPLSFFPSLLRRIVFLSPLPILAYLPAVSIQTTDFSSLRMPLLAAFFWALVLPLLAFKFWQLGIKRYEAIGI